MRLAAFILGLIAGIFGLIGTFFGLVLAGAANDLQHKDGSGDAGRIFGGMVCAVAVIVLAAILLKSRHPKVLGSLLVVASILGLSLAGGFFFAGVLSFIAGALAFFIRDPRPAVLPA